MDLSFLFCVRRNMPTDDVNLDTHADLVIERHVLFDKFGMSNLGEHNVVVVRLTYQSYKKRVW